MIRKPKNKEEALAIIAKRKQKQECPDEDKLQQSIVTAFVNKYPERRLSLMGYDANGATGQEGRKKMSMGVIPGVPDLMLFEKNSQGINSSCGIELKVLNSSHDAKHLTEQANWILNSNNRGGFCFSLEQFWRIYEKKESGYCPKKMIKLCKNRKSITFNKKTMNYLHIK